MSTRTSNSLILVGSGPGTGRAVAALFAEKRYDNVALISRSQSRLEEDKAIVNSAAKRSVNVKTYAIDITNEDVLAATLKSIEADLGRPETIFFNAARVQPSTLLETSPSEVEYDFKINTIALYNTARLVLPQLIELGKSDPSARPSLLVANSFVASSPLPPIFSLSIAKAAQRNLVQLLGQVYGGKGVQIAFVTIGGVISPDKKNMSPAGIAQSIWDFFASDDKKNEVELSLSDDE